MNNPSVVETLPPINVSNATTRSVLCGPDTTKLNCYNRPDNFITGRNGLIVREAPALTINVPDRTFVNGVGSLNLGGGLHRRSVVSTFNEYGKCDERPKTLLVNTPGIVGDTTAQICADVNVASKDAMVDCCLDNGSDAVSVGIDTTDGLVRLSKYSDLNGRRLILHPTVNGGRVVVAADGRNFAELIVTHPDDSVVCYRMDDRSVIFPRVNLKTCHIAVRANCPVRVTAHRENLVWDYPEGSWVVNGNVPLITNYGSTVSLRRSICL